MVTRGSTNPKPRQIIRAGGATGLAVEVLALKVAEELGAYIV
jgi:hypothetical protein